MKRQMSVKSRRELMESLGERYRSGSRPGKCRILDEFRCRDWISPQARDSPPEAGQGGTAVDRAGATTSLRRRGWRGAGGSVGRLPDRVCGKRLKALIPTMLDALERHGHLRLDG